MKTKTRKRTSRMIRTVRVAGAQIAVCPNDIAFNLEKVAAYLRRAVGETDAELVVFPETVTTGFTPGMPAADFYQLLPSSPLKLLRPIQQICRELKTHCVLPTYERTPKRNVIYNSAFLIDSRGEVLGVYRKTHPFPLERLSAGGWTTPGMRYPVFPTAIGTVGIMICYEGDFPEVARILAVKGAQIIARPSALLRSYEIWEMTNMGRAYDNHVYVIAVNAVGADAADFHYFGHSMIVSPIAQKLALARGTEEVIYADLHPDPIKRVTYGSDAPMLFDHLHCRNVESYGTLLTRKAISSFEPAKRYDLHAGARKPRRRRG